MAEEKIAAPPDVEKPIPRSTSAVQEMITRHGMDADEAMKAFEGYDPIVLDEVTSKRLLRSIDWHLMP
ncbi:hypothetical protein MMC13_002069, partial [Lambiella insularis]|nr:hypothetical protein [Lambiella insularis]